MKGDAMPSVKALGRGFEEISHLFLSNTAAVPVAAGAVQPAADRTQGVGPRTQLVTVRREVSLTKAQIIAALRDSRRFFDDDLVEIGAGFACSPFGEIDLLALDRDRRLTVVEVQNALDDTLVARGLSHIDWVVRNIPTVRRLYPAWPIDASRQPRLALVAPRFSLALRSGIRQITVPAIACFRYCEVDLPGEAGILVERL